MKFSLVQNCGVGLLFCLAWSVQARQPRSCPQPNSQPEMPFGYYPTQWSSYPQIEIVQRTYVPPVTPKLPDPVPDTTPKKPGLPKKIDDVPLPKKTRSQSDFVIEIPLPPGAFTDLAPTSPVLVQNPPFYDAHEPATPPVPVVNVKNSGEELQFTRIRPQAAPQQRDQPPAPKKEETGLPFRPARTQPPPSVIDIPVSTPIMSQLPSARPSWEPPPPCPEPDIHVVLPRDNNNQPIKPQILYLLPDKPTPKTSEPPLMKPLAQSPTVVPAAYLSLPQE